MASLLVSTNLVKLFNNKELADMRVTIGYDKFSCYKVLMCLSSHFFRRLCCGSNASFLELDLSDLPGGSNAFGAVCNFCSGKQVTLTVGNVLQVMAAAHYLEVSELLARCRTFWHTEVLSSWKSIMELTRTKIWTLHISAKEKMERSKECTVALCCLVSRFDTSDWESLIKYLLCHWGNGACFETLLDRLQDLELTTHLTAGLLLALESDVIHRWQQHPKREPVRLNSFISHFHGWFLGTKVMLVDEKMLHKAIEGCRTRVQLLSIMSFFCSYFSHVEYENKLVVAYSKLFSLLELDDLVGVGPHAVLLLIKPFKGVEVCVHARKISGIINQLADMVTSSDQALAAQLRFFVAGLYLFNQSQEDDTAKVTKRKLCYRQDLVKKAPKVTACNNNCSSTSESF